MHGSLYVGRVCGVVLLFPVIFSEVGVSVFKINYLHSVPGIYIYFSCYCCVFLFTTIGKEVNTRNGRNGRIIPTDYGTLDYLRIMYSFYICCYGKEER